MCDESRAVVRKYLPDYLREWRRRVSDRASSNFFGIVLRQVGPDGAGVLVGEWKGMNENERTDLLKRFVHEDSLPPVARTRTVEALFDESYDVRDAAFEALEAHAAPLGELDASAREKDLEKARARLLRWAVETGS